MSVLLCESMFGVCLYKTGGIVPGGHAEVHPPSFGQRFPLYLAPGAARALIRRSMLRRAETLADRGDHAGLFDLLDRLEAFDRAR
jgi:hypothetical protein